MDRSEYFRSNPKYFADLAKSISAVRSWTDLERLEARVVRDASVVAQSSTSQARDGIHRSIYAHAVTQAPVHPINDRFYPLHQRSSRRLLDRAAAELYAMAAELAMYDPIMAPGWYYAASIPFAVAPDNETTRAAINAGHSLREAIAAGAPFQDPIDKP